MYKVRKTQSRTCKRKYTEIHTFYFVISTYSQCQRTSERIERETQVFFLSRVMAKYKQFACYKYYLSSPKKNLMFCCFLDFFHFKNFFFKEIIVIFFIHPEKIIILEEKLIFSLKTKIYST